MSEAVLSRASVARVRAALAAAGFAGEIRVLADSTRTAAEAAAALGVAVGQIASSIVFRTSDGSPVLVITSGAHRVDANLVAASLGLERLERVDADYVKSVSGFSIGGVSPLGWTDPPTTALIDEDLAAFDVIWAAAGHPHAVFPTTFAELRDATQSRSVRVANAGA
ncbi:MAG TPA: YbaK/EbsC family protein [Acidimicrobiales bacterium]|nr:YbaK/EbsC family protein [Acidimicrobiales bacterium]